MKHGKKYRGVMEKIDAKKAYTIAEAAELLKAGKIAKFDESVEVHMHLSIDPKKGEEMVRGTVTLPHGTGKMVKIAVITSSKQEEAKAAGADVVGGEELIKEIKEGKVIDKVNAIIATPEMMPKLAQVAKILGPKGLMPSPKTETVTEKVKEAIESLKKGKTSFKNDDSANIHQMVGKISFDSKKLEENIVSFKEAIDKAKPKDFKGKLILSMSICSTMGPSIKITY